MKIKLFICTFVIAIILVIFCKMELYHPRPKTPSKIPTPTKSLFKSPSSQKKCTVCQRSLGPDYNYKNYRLIIATDIPKRIVQVIGRETSMPSNYMCKHCENALNQIEKAINTKQTFVKSFEDHCTWALRTKRMARQSPQGKPRAKRSLSSQPLSTLQNAPQSASKENQQPTLSSKASYQTRPPLALALPLDEVDNIRQHVFEQIGAECEDLCSTNYKSHFRVTDQTSLQAFSYTDQEKELEDKAPTFLKSLKAAAVNKQSLARNKSKSYASIVPGIMSAAGTLLQCRNNQMVAHATITGLQLKSGGATKQTHKRLQSRQMAVSYSTIIQKQEMLGIGFDEPVKQWQHQMEQDATRLAELQKEIEPLADKIKKSEHDFRDFLRHRDLKAEMDKVRSERHPGFQLVGDNIDFTTNPRQFTTESGRKSIHYFNFMAVKNKVSGNDKDDTKPIADLETCPLSTFLPSHDDNLKLRSEWAILIGRIITSILPHFEKYKKYVPDYIPHQYSDQMKTKTEVIGLGVILESENSSEGIVKIMDYMNEYVPHGKTDKPIQILSAGDQLTCERELNVQESRRDTKPAERWAGMLPQIADFHALANFYEWIWKQLYTDDAKGCRDVGTLYAAKVFLKATDVRSKPTACFYAFEELLDKYLKALVLAAALDFFQMKDATSEPTANTQESHIPDEQYINHVLCQIVDGYAIQHEPRAADIEAIVFKCPDCNKKPYKTLKGLKKHIKNKHAESVIANREIENMERSKATIGDYCRTALAMILLAHDFTDARKCGDGERLMRLYRFLILHFKAAGKTKYAHHCLRLVAQVKCLLTPKMSHLLTWNRFVNNMGHKDSNIEVDRENEHRNKIIKQETRSFYGKLSDKSIKRVGEAAQTLEKVLHQVDKESHVKQASGRHNKVDTSADVLALTDVYHKERVFESGPDRQLHALPDYKKDPFSHLDLGEVHQWMTTVLDNISNHKVFDL